MRLEHFQYLIVISKFSSMNQASESLHISPQALSIAIAKLETELNLKLITTTNKGTTLTDKGQLLVEYAQNFFDALASLSEQDEKEPEKISLNIISPIGVKEDNFADFLKNIKVDFPQFECTMTYLTSKEIIEHLRNHDDNSLLLLYRTLINGKSINDLPSTFTFMPLHKSSLYCILNAKYLSQGQDAISLKSLLKSHLPIIVYQHGEASINDIIHKYDPAYKITTESSISFLQSSIANNECITFTTFSKDNRSLIAIPNNCSAIKLQENIQIEFGYLIKNDTTYPTWFWKFITYLQTKL